MKQVSSPGRLLPSVSSPPPPPLHRPVSPSAGSHLRRVLAVREDLYLQALLRRARAE